MLNHRIAKDQIERVVTEGQVFAIGAHALHVRKTTARLQQLRLTHIEQHHTRRALTARAQFAQQIAAWTSAQIEPPACADVTTQRFPKKIKAAMPKAASDLIAPSHQKVSQTHAH